MKEFSVEILPSNSADTVVLKPKGSIDSTSTPILETRFNLAIEGEQHRIVLDLSETDFISSAGLGLILGTVGSLRENKGDLLLMNIPDQIVDVFETMSVMDYFETITDLEQLSISTEG